jgi:hypothetical protein
MLVDLIEVTGESDAHGVAGSIDVPEGYEPFAIRWPSTGDQARDTFGPWPFVLTCWRRRSSVIADPSDHPG